MAVPDYTTDLLPISACEVLGTWVEPSATGWLGGGIPALEVENYIQGSGSISKTYNAGTPAAPVVGGMIFDYAGGISIPSGSAFFGWLYWASPATLSLEASGGLRAICGDLRNAFYGWKLGGSDTYIYGGWQSFAVDPNIAVKDYTVGSPSGVWQWFGFCVSNTNAIAKGNPMLTDMYRYGRGEMRINGGETGGYATFPGFAALNDNYLNRWGIFQSIPGGYSWKGLMILGYTSAVDFRDSDRSITIENTKKVMPGFNKIEIRQAGSRVDWTRINFAALGTVSRGAFECIDDADVNLDTCVFTDMDSFIFKASSAALDCTFRRCGQITAPGMTLSGSIVDSYTGAADTSAVVWNVDVNPDGKLDNMSFVKGTNAHHAIEFGITSPTSMTLRGIAFSGFNASNGENDSTLHIKRTSGSVTIYLVGCSGTVSVKTAGADVTLVQNPVTFTVTTVTTDGTPIEDVLVLVLAKDATGPMPYDDTVTIVNTGTLATVSHMAHGMLTLDKVKISGASLDLNNGVFSITKTGDDTYTYTMAQAPGSSPTGTIKATYVALFGLTNSNGVITDSRVFSDNQPITGRARKSSAVPFYKTSGIPGTINNTSGWSATVPMIGDE